MASLTRDPNGSFRIQVIGTDRKRRSIRLGKLSEKASKEILRRVEHLHELTANRLAIDTDTAAWLNGIGDDLAEKLSAAGLIPPRESRTLGDFLETYIENRKAESKPTTIITLQQVKVDMVKLYGPKMALRDIGPEDAEGLKTHYFAKGLALATICRRLKVSRMFFARAKTYNLIPDNPFMGVKSKNTTAPEHQRYITTADTLRILEKATPTWRIIIALARFAGLRCPTEVLSLRWEDVDLPAGRMVVHSPKTEHMSGKENRIVPVFATLRPYLEDAFELAKPGDVFVVSGPQPDIYRTSAKGSRGWNAVNLRTPFLKLLRRAGLKVYPRPFRNLRSSLETELSATHPIHVVTAWLGNTPNVALGHYLQTLESDFAKATSGVPCAGSGSPPVQSVQNQAQTGEGGKGPEKTNPAKSPATQGLERTVENSLGLEDSNLVVAEGIEPPTLPV
ncbi:hypothetical protein BH11PLA2_BH11PLA2_01740 [soil metagenome]